jgi:hypothetical protein
METSKFRACDSNTLAYQRNTFAVVEVMPGEQLFHSIGGYKNEVVLVGLDLLAWFELACACIALVSQDLEVEAE